MFQNFTTKGTMVFIVALTIFGKFPFQKFLIWFTFLEIPALGTSSMHTRRYEELSPFPEAVVQGGAFVT